MPETNWGRKETIIWPPHTPIYTFGAVFLALILTGLFVYLGFAFALSPLEQFYLPLYIKTSIAPSLRSSGKYQMLLMSDRKSRAWYAREVDVAVGSTPQANAKPIPLMLSDSARQHGMVSLYRSAPNVYQNSALGGYLKQQVYSGASIVDLFQWPLIFGAIALLGQLPLSIPKDIRRRKQMKYGRRLKCYLESPENTLIVSPDNASRRELNVAVRQELKANGNLATEDHTFRVLVQRQDMTGAERSWASHYEINEVVRYTRGSKAIGIEAGAYASIVAISPSANQLTVEKANGELATYDPRRLTGVSVYHEIEREFSVGDRIQFTAPDKSLGVANRDMAAIEAIHPDGRLSVRLDNNRQIEFNPNEHRHLDHGYAVTSHSSQGLTAERVLVHADTRVHPDLLNSRFAYVSISRASFNAEIYTNDATDLAPRLCGDVSKSSAVEFSHSTANPMTDLSLGQGI